MGYGGWGQALLNDSIVGMDKMDDCQIEDCREFTFEKLEAYQAAVHLMDMVYDFLVHAQFPNEERYALCDQLRRAVCSVPSNIAEGSGRSSFKEKIHFLEIAYGSLMETYCQLQIALRRGYIDQAQFSKSRNQSHKVAKLLSGLRTYYNSQFVRST